MDTTTFKIIVKGFQGEALLLSLQFLVRPADGLQGLDNSPQQHENAEDQDPMMNTNVTFSEIIDEGAPAFSEAGGDEDKRGHYIRDRVFKKVVKLLHRYPPSSRGNDFNSY